jgi:predicted nucleic acid-binding protein
LQERHHFRLYSSRQAEFELSRGLYRGQSSALKAVRRLEYLPWSVETDRCANKLQAKGIVPPSEPGDAYHLAFAIAYRIDYLLTWNQAHLANASVQRVLERLCESEGWRAPLLHSPESIPWVSYGREIQRKD